MNQLTFASLTPKKKNTLRQEMFLEDMSKIVPWKKIAKLIRPYYYSNTTGRPAYDLVQMIKIHCLQQWYNLGDLAMEEAIYDRRSFAKFLNIDLMNNRIPDETTILNFRHLIEKNQIASEFFDLINKQLEKQGLMMKKGTIVDATIIESPSSTKNQDGKRDQEMSSTKKNGKWYFGMKTHIGTDMESGLIHSCAVSTAKVADVEMMGDLLHWNEAAVLGDKGYVSKENKKWARANGIFWGVLDRRGPKRKISSGQKKRNNKLSKIRAKVEHPFRIIKDLWGHRKTRYKGLKKNESQMKILCGLTNLYLARKSILQGM